MEVYVRFMFSCGHPHAMRVPIVEVNRWWERIKDVECDECAARVNLIEVTLLKDDGRRVA